MAFDSTVMAAVTAELASALTGGRINKIYQPGPDRIVLVIYAHGRNHRLLISAHPRHARLHLTQMEERNPPAPPTFCMLLRKYVEGGRILQIHQVGRERICHIRIGVIDELGNPAEFVLVAEVMGKHSNIVLLNPQNRIVDAIYRITEEVNRYRELLPGLPYIAPPPTGKIDPEALTSGDLQPRDEEAELPAWRLVLDRVDALGPLLAREAVCRAGFDPEAPASAVSPERLVDAVRSLFRVEAYEPCLLYDPQGKLKDFHVLPLAHWQGRRETGFASVSAAVEAFFGLREEEERLTSLRGALARLLRDETARVRRKLEAQRESLAKAENAETYRLYGELITANLWQLQKGQKEAVVPNYYDPEGRTITIPLDPALTPLENAQAYYRKYQKARSSLSALQEQVARSESELAYLEQVEVALQEARSLPDLEEIRRELAAEGYLSEDRGHRSRSGSRQGEGKEQKPAPPLTVRSTDGLEIWIGRNNRQNDYLTLKLAAPHDLWFHAKNIPGSHVILRVPPGRAVPERAIYEAAVLAAYYSKARNSSGVPVDYTLRKYVRKPNGARPGMVVYEQYKTIWVTPDPQQIAQLQEGGHHDTAGADSESGGDP
ncbi:MAG TPA: NFACT RNA binding domain-containing protein [Symbiobacteriaceae bacterium]